MSKCQARFGFNLDHLSFPSCKIHKSWIYLWISLGIITEKGFAGVSRGAESDEFSGGDGTDKLSGYSAKATDEWGEEYEPDPEEHAENSPATDVNDGTQG